MRHIDRSTVSWQLSTSMNSSGALPCGAVRTMSAWALPLPGPFCVPVAGSETSVEYEAMVPIPGGASTAAWAAARTSADSLVSLARFGFGRSIAITVSLTAIGWEAPLEPGITVSSLLRAVWFVVGDL
ncbi:hypothetical protein [Streptomyces olivaceoviridis]